MVHSSMGKRRSATPAGFEGHKNQTGRLREVAKSLLSLATRGEGDCSLSRNHAGRSLIVWL